MSLLEVRGLTVHYRTRAGMVRAAEGVSFTLEKGEALGLVGESGSGKTTVALALLRILPDNALVVRGQVLLEGVDLLPLPEERMRHYRWKRIAMVFQAAMNSLDPVYRVGEQIAEAVLAHDRTTPARARERAASLFEMVGLEAALLDRYPHELSGGQRQRAVIAMALSCSPDILIADEPTTALDVVTQDRILRQLSALRRRLGMGVIYISHDIAVVAEVSDRIAVMYAGRVVELAPTETLFASPFHPYTYALLTSLPSIHGERRTLTALPGEPPDLLRPPPGCPFHPRCPNATDICGREEPPLVEMAPGHWAACWNPVKESLHAPR